MLSHRQTQILAWVAAGRTTKEISAQLGISDSTVNWHVARILVKLEASSRAEAVGSAFREGLLPLSTAGQRPRNVEATIPRRTRATRTRRIARLAVLGLSLADVNVETWIEEP